MTELGWRKMIGARVALLCGVAVLLPAPAFAQVAASDEGGNEIVVTAQRRNSSIQDSPLTVQVIGGDTLQSRGVTNLDQIAAFTPGLKIDNNAGRGYVYIRGIGTDSVGIGVDPSVATYVDGVYLSRGNAIFSGLWDIDHIEVLKGPQGTLYGRNATGGAILTVTKQPELDKVTGYGFASYGNLNRKKVEGAVNLPIGDKVAVRISGLYLDDDGYMNNLYTGEKEGNQTVWGVRATALLQATDNFAITLSGFHMKQTGSRGATFKLDPGQPSPTLTAFPSTTVPTGQYDVRYNLPNSATLEMSGGSATLRYDGGPIALKSITGYAFTRSNRVLDFDATEQRVNETYKGLEQSKSFTQSVQANNAEPAAFNWMVGADYLHETLAADIRSRFASGADRILIASNTTDAMSAFVDLNYKVVGGLRLMAGARYNVERKAFTFNTLSHGSWEQVTPKFGLQYDLSRDVMLYATATRGFKSGGFNSSAVQPPFGPEKIWSYEAGIKSQWLDHRLTLNLAGFYYDYKDLQVTQIDPNNGAVPITTNAGTAKVKGIDGEVSFRPVRAFRIGGSFTWLDSSFGRLLLQNVSLAGSPYVNVEGNRFSRAPDFSAAADAAYTLDLGTSDLTLAGAARYNSRIFFSPFETYFVSQAPYAVADARLTWSNGTIDVTGFVNNLTNKYYVTTVQTYPTAIGTSYLPAEPRTYGVSVKYSF